ncbi:MAG: substrate-binding domain-containing protein [Candidatus Dormibacteraceae bacterium]
MSGISYGDIHRATRSPIRPKVATAMAVITLAACGGSSTSGGGTTTNSAVDPYVAIAAATALKAESPVTTWDGPTTGPKGVPGKFVVCVSEDQTNAGPAGVCAGAQAAAQALGWKFQILDSKGTAAGDLQVMNQALALKADGIVNASIADSIIGTQLQAAQAMGIKVVGWHATTYPGPDFSGPEFYNVQSDQVVAGQVMSDYVIASTNGKAGVAVVDWSIFPIAVLKVNSMLEEIRRCRDCKILSQADIPLTSGAQEMPTYVTGLIQKYGKQLTDIMYINDGYADYSLPAYAAAGIGPSGPPVMVSFGDGSAAAYARIRSGQYQTATVPEPLSISGWQMIDEMNRAFAGQPPSGYIQPVHLVTKTDVNADGGANNIFDPQNGYVSHYKAIWGV